jgi:hypothetical protein
VFIALQFVNLGSATQSDVAWWCHVGGMAAGAVLFPIMKRADVRLFECMRSDGIRLESAPPLPRSAHLPNAPR